MNNAALSNLTLPNLSKSKKTTQEKSQEKTNKKVSRACNTCRLKRKKCDGLEPCYFCKETKVECSYSREPRRRGPPSGYLRYTETRVSLLETLLGLLCSSDNLISTLLSLSLTLKSESKTCTQDVWDRYKAIWSGSQAAAVIEELAVGFAPFTHNRGEGGAVIEGYAKPLLPPTSEGTSRQKKDEDRSPSPQLRRNNHPHPSPSPRSVSFALPAPSPPFSPAMLPRESFERTRNVRGPSLDTISDRHSPIDPTSPMSLSYPNDPSPSTSKSSSASALYPPIYVSHPQDPHMNSEYLGSVNSLDSTGENMYTGSYWRTAELALEGIPMFDDIEVPQVHKPPSMNYWNPINPSMFTPSTSSDSIPSATNLLSSLLATSDPSTIESIDIPPLHILTNLIDVYYTHIHPTFPVLSDRTSLDNIVRDAANGTGTMAGTALGLGIRGSGKSLGDTTTCMLLAMCAYAGRLSPNMDVSALADDSTRNIGARLDYSSVSAADLGIFLGSDASKIAADLWYEQARDAVNLLLRKPAKLETVRALLLLALRDYGKGGAGESQAWLLVGMAIRLGQELELPASAGFSPHFLSVQTNNVGPTSGSHAKLRTKYTQEEHIARGNLWGIATMLDSFLSLQLGRTPAVAEVLRPNSLGVINHLSGNPINGADIFPRPTNGLVNVPAPSPPPLFAYSYSLSQIISKINFWLYLGFGPASSSPSTLSVQQSSVGHVSSVSSSSNLSATITPNSSWGETPENNSVATQAKLGNLRAELDGWLQALPNQFRVSIGGGLGTKEVLEINMFYHVAVILLYKPFVKDKSAQQAAFTDIFLDAASTFNLLLDKYQNQSVGSIGVPALSVSNPSLIYLIFTVALAHLSGYRSRWQQIQTRAASSPHQRPLSHSVSPYQRTLQAQGLPPSYSPTSTGPGVGYPPRSPHVMSPTPSTSTPNIASVAPPSLTPQQQTQQLQTQLHLMNCLDALKVMGKTWELARRCWRTLDQLMDKEGMKPGGTGIVMQERFSVPLMSPGLGKRKRDRGEGDEDEESPLGRPRTDLAGHWQSSVIGHGRGQVSLNTISGSASSPDSTISYMDSNSASGTSPYTPDAPHPHGTPIHIESEPRTLMDWTKIPVQGTTSLQSPPKFLGVDPPPFFSSGWLSDFEAEFLDVGGGAGGVSDVGTSSAMGAHNQSHSGGWGLQTTGMEHWNGWSAVGTDSTNAHAWEEKILWGKSKDGAPGFDGG